MAETIRLVSGGQTGADRAALDFALSHGIPCGGFCPRGRKAEDGRIGDHYPLTETSSAEYPPRTELNIKQSDGTVLFSISPQISGGSKKTVTLAAKLGKPLLHISRETPDPVGELRRFIEEHKVRVLNCAGPRASKEPEVADFVREVLACLF